MQLTVFIYHENLILKLQNAKIEKFNFSIFYNQKNFNFQKYAIRFLIRMTKFRGD